uniref:Uncharacterized protein n=1 Tax=Anopheles merus TaxID=30066 RepID=A0A182V8L7_ANOME
MNCRTARNVASVKSGITIVTISAPMVGRPSRIVSRKLDAMHRIGRFAYSSPSAIAASIRSSYSGRELLEIGTNLGRGSKFGAAIGGAAVLAGARAISPPPARSLTRSAVVTAPVLPNGTSFGTMGQLFVAVVEAAIEPLIPVYMMSWIASIIRTSYISAFDGSLSKLTRASASLVSSSCLNSCMLRSMYAATICGTLAVTVSGCFFIARFTFCVQRTSLPGVKFGAPGWLVSTTPTSFTSAIHRCTSCSLSVLSSIELSSPASLLSSSSSALSSSDTINSSLQILPGKNSLVVSRFGSISFNGGGSVFSTAPGYRVWSMCSGSVSGAVANGSPSSAVAPGPDSSMLANVMSGMSTVDGSIVSVTMLVKIASNSPDAMLSIGRFAYSSPSGTTSRQSVYCWSA